QGLRECFKTEELEISEDIPSVCAEKLMSGQVDIGLVPVATIEKIPDAEIFSDHCIACDGDVGSVLLVSESPISEIDEVLLDYQSRTSVRLVKILLKEFWKKNVRFREALPGYEANIQGATAGVIIGDRALILRKNFEYTYDLGAEWKRLTGLPFVFATWTTRIRLEAEFIKRFNEALKKGLAQREHLASIHQSEEIPEELLKDYWNEKIIYDLGEKEISGLTLFLEKSKTI
ncbi:MAG: menaquinone biosynthetic enzyme MqnA/MqnD family protein, partial [Bacteroidota bacterium]